METKLRGATNFNERSDYAIALLFLGRNGEAVELLEALEVEQPGTYFVAANLGTAYELSGRNEDALKWIREGIRRNPESHEGSEWLHAKILEAKIAHQKDPAYFESHSVLELAPGTIGQAVSIDGQGYRPKDLAAAIGYQLGERLQFVKPPDPAVASLLFDYAALDAVLNSMESAGGVLKMAGEYGFPVAKVDALAADFERRLRWADFRFYTLCFAIGVAVLWVLKQLRRRGLFVLSSRDMKRV
jgi:tetratricopeptide (TPR) repeat protein